MAASMEEVQEELAAIRANVAERDELERSIKTRAKFLDDPANEFGYQMTVGIANMVGVPVDAVNAILNAAGVGTEKPFGSGGHVQDVLATLHDIPSGLEEDPQSPLGGAANMIGATAVVTPVVLAPFVEAAMDPNFDLRQIGDISKFQGTGAGTPGEIPRSRAARAAFLLKQLGEQAAKTAVRNPKTFVAGEMLAAGAVGAAGEQAESMEITNPTARLGIETTAGVVGGIAPASIPRHVKNMWRWGLRNLAPFTRAGAEARAASQMQARTADPQAAAAKVRANTQAGITPARATGEEQLMAQEARVLQDDLALDRIVRTDLENAVRRSQNELSSLYGTPRGRESWEQAVFQRVAPEGVVVNPGTSERMLDQVYDSFKPLYGEFNDYQIMPNMFGARKTSLETMIANVPQTNRIQIDEAKREAVARRLNAMWSGLARRLKPNKDGVVVADSADYLKFRQKLRAEARARSKIGDHESAALYELAEEKVNDVLRSQLEPDVLKGLSGVDSYYRNYKILEDAVYRRSGTDSGLTPDGLLMALKSTASSKGGYARGDQLELRAAAVSGKPIAQVIDDPSMIRRRVDGMGAEDLQNTKSDFFDTLMRKAMVSQDETEGVSGLKLLRLLDHYKESALAVRMSEDELARAKHIAQELAVAERKSPAAVAQLYEDGPSTMFELFATLAGAKYGQNVAGRGMGSGLVLAGYFAKKARNLLGHITTDQAKVLLTRAQTDPELYVRLLTKRDVGPAQQVEAAQFIHAYLAEMAREETVEAAGYYRETHRKEKVYAESLRRLQEQTGRGGRNY